MPATPWARQQSVIHDASDTLAQPALDHSSCFQALNHPYSRLLLHHLLSYSSSTWTLPVQS